VQRSDDDPAVDSVERTPVRSPAARRPRTTTGLPAVREAGRRPAIRRRSNRIAGSPRGGRAEPADPNGDRAGIEEWGHPAHRHPHAQFVGAIMGRATITIEGSEFEADPRWGVWIPPLILHSARFHERFVPLIRNGGPVHREQPTAVFVDPALRHALLTSRGAADTADASVDSPIDATLAEAIRHSRTGLRLPCPVASGRLTLPIVEALEADPADPRTLADWALHLHVSSISIRRAFDAELGMTFSDWRTRARVNAAILLLDDGESVSATARAVGMSHNGLIAAFRRHIGATPTSLQRR
jgi:AraC-like DNA-binding protein